MSLRLLFNDYIISALGSSEKQEHKIDFEAESKTMTIPKLKDSIDVVISQTDFKYIIQTTQYVLKNLVKENIQAKLSKSLTLGGNKKSGNPLAILGLVKAPSNKLALPLN